MIKLRAQKVFTGMENANLMSEFVSFKRLQIIFIHIYNTLKLQWSNNGK